MLCDLRVEVLKRLKAILLCASLSLSHNVSADYLSEELFEQHSAVMLVITPSTGAIVAANSAADKFYGYQAGELEQWFIQNINQLTPEQVANERANAAVEGRNYFIFRHQLANGEIRTVSVHSAPFIDEYGRQQLLSVITDISEQRALQKSLWHYQANLEQQVEIQTDAIQQASQMQLLLSFVVIVLLIGSLLILGRFFIKLKNAKRKADSQGARLSSIFDAIEGYLLFTSRTGTLLDANQQVFKDIESRDSIVGRALGEVFFSNMDWTNQSYGCSEHRLKVKGEWRFFKVDKQAVNNADKSLGDLYMLQDITAQLAIEREQRLASTVFATTSEGVLVSDKHNQIQMVNRAFTEITGFTQEQVLGQSPAILNSGHHGPAFFSQMYDTLSQRGHWEGEVWNRRKSGEVFPCWLQVSAVFDQQGEIEMHVALFNDITSRKHHEHMMWQQANFDTLTSLANRRNYREKFENALQKAKKDKSRLAVCFIDLDRFKAVNDTLGHHIGDLMLIEAAKRLEECTKNSDTVARLGGDEFALLLPGVDSIAKVEQIAAQILETLHEPYELEGHEVFASGSMGITFYPEDGDDTKVLLRNADNAMYKAKELGRNCFQFYTSAMHEHAKARSQLEGALHKALVNNELHLAYQPILSRDDDRVGCEALLRWENKALGSVSPADFIPICEELGLIISIGEWVMYQACSQAKAWQQQCDKHFFITVNVSSTQFKRQSVVELVKKVLAQTGLEAKYLSIEITETVLVDNSESILLQLKALRAMGVELAIDDFGTGYSSLSYLKRFPLSKLKIDREFVRDLPDDQDDHEMVKAIISMASNLNLKVVAEGVETDEQLWLLNELGCDFTQGYLHSKPLKAAAFEHFLRDYMK